MQLGKLKAGDSILDLIGPLGRPTHHRKLRDGGVHRRGDRDRPVYPIVKECGKRGTE